MINIEYSVIVSYPLFSILLSAAFVGASRVAALSSPSVEKCSPYECGFTPFGDARLRFNSQYYIVCLLFLIFDLELVLLLPWCLCLGSLSPWGFFSAILFLFLLVCGFVYEWYLDALV
jgi:NADH-quinone oxidoreductase subunit A